MLSAYFSYFFIRNGGENMREMENNKEVAELLYFIFLPCLIFQ